MKMESLTGFSSSRFHRRVSRTFRRAPPAIVVHPPEDNLTSSMPDIFDFDYRENNCRCTLNYSMPNLEKSCAGGNESDTSLRSSEESFESCKDSYELSSSYPPASQSLYTRQSSLPSDNSKTPTFSYDIAETTPEPHHKPFRNRRKNSYTKLRPKNFETTPRRKTPRRRHVEEEIFYSPIPPHSSHESFASTPKSKKKDISPSELLRNKLKQSISMHNLYRAEEKQKKTFDNYHTFHGELDYDLKTTTTAKRNSVGTIRECRGFDETNAKQKRYDRIREISRDFNATVIVMRKCCCGDLDCDTVVPLQHYLETYFRNTVRTFTRIKNKKKHPKYARGNEPVMAKYREFF